MICQKLVRVIITKVKKKKLKGITKGHPPKALILQAGYTSISTLVFEYNIIPYLSLLTPLTYNPKLQGKIVMSSA